jgi:hypothetical protein
MRFRDLVVTRAVLKEPSACGEYSRRNAERNLVRASIPERVAQELNATVRATFSSIPL